MRPEPKLLHLNIVAGILERRGRFLLCRRQAGSHLAGTWEFPGGKIRPGESLEEALKRELDEEVGIGFRESVLLHVEEHIYPDRKVSLYFCLCLDPSGEPISREGQEIRWLSLEEIASVETPPANRRVLGLLKEQFE
jgi:8-oxo-dGTP diphosphatase